MEIHRKRCREALKVSLDGGSLARRLQPPFLRERVDLAFQVGLIDDRRIEASFVVAMKMAVIS